MKQGIIYGIEERDDGGFVPYVEEHYPCFHDTGGCPELCTVYARFTFKICPDNASAMHVLERTVVHKQGGAELQYPGKGKA